MVAFRLPVRTDLNPILDGARDVVLARPPSAGRRDRLPRVGGGISLFTEGPAEGDTKALAPRQVRLRADVSFAREGVKRVSDVDSLTPGTVEGVHALLQNAEQGSAAVAPGLAADVFARRAGFADYAALWRSLRASDADVVHRVVIQWGAPL